MKRTENGVILTNEEADVVVEVLDNAIKLTQGNLHNFAVELDGRPEIMGEDYIPREKGEIGIDYRVAEEEVVDSINIAMSILQDSTDEKIKFIRSQTTDHRALELIDAFIKIEE